MITSSNPSVSIDDGKGNLNSQNNPLFAKNVDEPTMIDLLSLVLVELRIMNFVLSTGLNVNIDFAEARNDPNI